MFDKTQRKIQLAISQLRRRELRRQAEEMKALQVKLGDDQRGYFSVRVSCDDLLEILADLETLEQQVAKLSKKQKSATVKKERKK